MGDQFAELFARVEKEKDLQQVVKAEVESSLGKLGNVPALAVDDFLERLKGAIQDAETAQGSRAGSVAGFVMPSVASGSEAPSEFGERSIVPSGPGAPGVSCSSKPGNESHKIMW